MAAARSSVGTLTFAAAVIIVQVVIALPSCVAAFPFIYPNASDYPNVTNLYFGLMEPFSGGFDGSGVVPGVEVALDQINSDPSILPGYSLHYILVDGQCERDMALQQFFGLILSDPVLVAWIGSGCSSSTEPTAEISHYYNITQISCLSSSSELRNRNRFRYYFQMLLTEDNTAIGFLSIIKRYQWRRVALIVQDENVFTAAMDRLATQLNTSGIEFSRNTFSTEVGVAELGSQIFAEGTRIFVLSMYEPSARDILCEAYRRDLAYPTHIFLTYAWYRDRWWRLGSHSCTPDERESVARYTLGPLQFEFISDYSVVADTGINGTQFNNSYFDRVNSSPLGYKNEFQVYATDCYDATWTLAYALNNTISDLQNMELLRSIARKEAGLDNSTSKFGLEDFTYRNNIIAETMFRHLNETNFTGITGRVTFDDQGIREGGFQVILQVRPDTNGEWNFANIGEVTGEDESAIFTYTEGFTDETVWPGGITPHDGVPIEETVTVAVALTVIYSLLAIAGVIFTTVCLGFNFIFRDRKLIKLTSPTLSYVIGVGAFMLYVDVILLVVPTTNRDAVSVLCNITPWLTSLGYSLCFGTMVAKMLRVYFIFTDPKPSKKNVLSDWKLALVILLMVVVDLVILGVYTLVEGVKGNLKAERIKNEEDPEDVIGEQEVIYQYYFYTCMSTSRDITLGILYGYKGALQAVSLLFAFQIRKVKVKGLNDAKYIAAAVYVTSIVLAVIFVCTYSLVEFVNVYPVVIGLGLLVGATGILLLTFVPKMVGLYMDPEGENVFTPSSQSQHANPPLGERLTASMEQRGDSDAGPNREAFDTLRRRVRELENKLVEYEANGSVKMNPESCGEGGGSIDATRKVSFNVNGSHLTSGTTSSPRDD